METAAVKEEEGDVGDVDIENISDSEVSAEELIAAMSPEERATAEERAKLKKQPGAAKRGGAMRAFSKQPGAAKRPPSVLKSATAGKDALTETGAK